jgi:hypothetical protein
MKYLTTARRCLARTAAGAQQPGKSADADWPICRDLAGANFAAPQINTGNV